MQNTGIVDAVQDRAAAIDAEMGSAVAAMQESALLGPGATARRGPVRGTTAAPAGSRKQRREAERAEQKQRAAANRALHEGRAVRVAREDKAVETASGERVTHSEAKRTGLPVRTRMHSSVAMDVAGLAPLVDVEPAAPPDPLDAYGV